jgi:hypothetical protein
VLDNSDSHQLLAIVSTATHKGTCQTLNNWALLIREAKLSNKLIKSKNWRKINDHLSLSELLALVSASSVCNESGVFALHGDEILIK